MLAANPPIRLASTGDFGPEIEKVLSRFKNDLTEDEQDEIENVSLGDLNEAIKKIQEKQRGTRSYRNLKRIKPFVTGMTEYGKVIAVFANAVPIVAFVWGPTKFLLQTASNYTDAFDLLLDAYKDIGNNLPQFGKYAQLFGDRRSVQNALLEVFEGVLRFHKQAMGFFRRSAWKQLFRASWDSFRGPFSDILNKLKKHQALLEREGHLANFENMSSLTGNMGSITGNVNSITENVNFMIKELEKRDEHNRGQQLVDTYRWLSAADYSSDHEHLLSLGNGFPGTSIWLFQRRDMITWQDGSSKVSTFWLHGILGSGKTIVASRVTEELILKARGMSSISVAYFYCKHGDTARDSCDGIFRAILTQLLVQNSDIVQVPYFNSHQLSLTHDPLKSEGLKSLVQTVFRVLNLVYVVIDGLDEIDRSERKEFFSIILPLLKSQLKEDTGYRIKLFISSRGEDDIRMNVNSIGRVWRKSYEISGDDNNGDIAVYASLRAQELQNKFGFDNSRREEIFKDVCERAGELIFGNLMNQTNLEELEEEMKPEILPSELKDAYARIFQHHNKYLVARKQAKSREILGLIGFSKRTLKTNDIQGALSVNTSNQTLNYNLKARCLKPDVASVIRELCSIIVEVRSDQSVGFIHTTARQFIRELYIREPASQNFRLTDLCLTYLTFDCVKLDLGEDKVQQSVLNGDYSFLEYAANNWLSHLRDLDLDRGRIDPEQYSDIRAKTKAVLDLHQPSRARHHTPAADIAWYFLPFSDCPEIYRHPALRGGAHRNQRLGEHFRDDPTGTDQCDLHPQPFLISSQLLRTRKALEQIAASPGAENIAFLRECYGPISFKCSVVGCLRYDIGFEKPQERDDHVRSHSRPSKCLERDCFYREVGFANIQSLNQHISRCHTDPASYKFIFPRLNNSGPPTEDEHMRFKDAITKEDLDLVRDLIRTNSSLQDRVEQDGHSYTGLQYAAMQGKVGSALLLLQCGSNLGAVNKHGTALNVACSWGKADMVQFLLSNSRCGEDVNSKDEWGMTPLSSVLKYHRTDATLAIVRLLLEDSRVFADSKDCTGKTPLSLAVAEQGSDAVPVIRLLLEHGGIDIDAKDDEGMAPLTWAVATGDSEVVEMLLEHGGIDADTKDNRGRTPLSLAVATGDSEAVEVLLEHGGIDADAKDDNGRTPLSLAAGGGDSEVVKMLLEHGGIDVDAKDNEGRTPLSRAAGVGHSGTVKLLLEHGEIDVNAKDNNGRTPLSLAAGVGRPAAVKLLLGHGGIDVDAKDNEGRTPLSRAAGVGRSGAVKCLLEHGGIDVDAMDNEGRTPLSWAAGVGRWRTVKMLLDHGGIDVEAKDNKGRTPLSWAAGVGLSGTVKMLLKHGGVNIDSKCSNGRTPLSWAAGVGDSGTVKTLLEHGGVDAEAKDNKGRAPLSWAAGVGHSGTVKLLLERGGIDADAKDSNGRTSLSWAAGTGDSGAVKMLLEHGGIDVEAKDNQGRTPLSWAAVVRVSGAAVKVLLGHSGVDVNARDNGGRTPLSWAAGEYGCSRTVQMLLEHDGTDVEAKDNQGRTPLSWAAGRLGNSETVQVLLGHSGIDVNARDNWGRTPLSWAASEKGDSETVVMLLGRGGSGVGVTGNEGRTPLSWAVGAGDSQSRRGL